MQIIIKNKNGEFKAILDDTLVARSFAAQLPIVLNLQDYANAEKYAKLKMPLDISNSPRGSDGKNGELSYFAPWHNFVIYYKNQPYYDGIVRLGEIADEDIAKVAIDGEIKIELVR
ncbi:cyclophilin-like fold protein [Campylobacter majalis]|uniref:cyclophilin-like fold protein n=1 Tax=Campylobacter majalis TaxID=2790656 RepID=UPI003D6933BB